MKLPRFRNLLPDWKNALLAVFSAVLLILAFPDFEFWFLAWFALVPLLFAIEREMERGHSCPHEPEGRTSNNRLSRFFRTLARSCGQECPRSFVLGWIFGFVFFSGTCWWLTYAPIHYAGFPVFLAYFLLFCVTAVAAIFPGIFGLLLSVFLRRFGSWAFLLAPFIWVFTEFLRYWVTGNNWNAIGYSQAFSVLVPAESARLGGVLLVSFVVAVWNAFFAFGWRFLFNKKPKPMRPTNRIVLNTFICYMIPILGGVLILVDPFTGKVNKRKPSWRRMRWKIVGIPLAATIFAAFCWFMSFGRPNDGRPLRENSDAFLIAVQPNVPMSSLNESKWRELRTRQTHLAESSKPDFKELVDQSLKTYGDLNNQYGLDREIYEKFFSDKFQKQPRVVVLPESPMNFMYGDDAETKAFINGFAARNNVSVLFNSAEPNKADHKYFNSAVLVGPEGKMIGQYDKIYLLPFGEAVPTPLESIVPAFVGSFSYGSEYDLLPIGDAKAGVMICFESHFGSLSREYVREGADVIIEMTNDGYLGPTPVLRQHLANTVFRAVETNRPVLRVTNVGVTAYINERGEVLDAAEPYTEATRVWSVSKSDGSQTFYVKYGDWFAWLCSIVTVGMLLVRRRQKPDR